MVWNKVMEMGLSPSAHVACEAFVLACGLPSTPAFAFLCHGPSCFPEAAATAGGGPLQSVLCDVPCPFQPFPVLLHFEAELNASTIAILRAFGGTWCRSVLRSTSPSVRGDCSANRPKHNTLAEWQRMDSSTGFTMRET